MSLSSKVTCVFSNDFLLELIIGFQPDLYTATESAGEVQVQFGILGPSVISANIIAVVQLSFTDGSAMRKSNFSAKK